ncbi:YitT family protein [Carnobacteriaceae bacterium zg-C25]|nr:YitT family protein [Carnobacteriaceae bacterium zg-C25]
MNRYKLLISIGAVVAASFLQTFVLQAVLNPAHLLPGGFLGLGVLVENVTGGAVPFSVVSWGLNFIVAGFCYKGISKRFTLLTLFQVTLSTFFLSVFNFEPIIDDVMLAVLVGGVLTGMYIVIALQGNASTGGTDFIALYVSNKKGRAIWQYVFIFNTCLLILFGFQKGFELAGYSIVFQFVTTKTIENFHNRYDQLTLQITTNYPEKVMNYYFDKHHHGMTCLEAVGGYTHRRTYILQTIVSAYEVKEITQGIIETDPAAIINVMRTKQFIGNFYRQAQD